MLYFFQFDITEFISVEFKWRFTKTIDPEFSYEKIMVNSINCFNRFLMTAPLLSRFNCRF